ncbi:trypsin-like peptidase domain-containing protein [Humidisolicoccus flavus]|uniref:S1C family serine protease n=1 Tax=Humidisolicoccus flavus TaxID=3111414 RepID=UPI003253DA44
MNENADGFAGQPSNERTGTPQGNTNHAEDAARMTNDDHARFARPREQAHAAPPAAQEPGASVPAAPLSGPPTSDSAVTDPRTPNVAGSVPAASTPATQNFAPATPTASTPAASTPAQNIAHGRAQHQSPAYGYIPNPGQHYGSNSHNPQHSSPGASFSQPNQAPQFDPFAQNFSAQYAGTQDWSQATQATGPVRETKRRRGTIGVLATAALVAVIFGGVGGVVGTHIASNGTAPSATVTGTSVSNPTTVSDVAAAATPSVVTISASDGQNSGTGSGVVIAAGGYIVTNNHVVTVGGATSDPSLTVETSDGRLLAAEIVGLDPAVDLAVLKVDADLPVLAFADGDTTNVGDLAIAIGAPLGLSNTVTEGIVSVTGRGLSVASSEAPAEGQDNSTTSPPFGLWNQNQSQQTSSSISVPVVQTDASINPGNSGGVLLNSAGQIIGINVAIASNASDNEQAGSIGLGFAIEAPLVQRVVDEIIESGTASHGLLGVTVQDVSDPSVGVVGAELNTIADGSPAASAGLRAGDVVTAIDGRTVTSGVDLSAFVRASAGGETVTLTVLRDGSSNDVEVTLGTL